MRITILALCARSSSSSYVDICTYMILESSKLIFNWTAYFSLILLLLSLRVRHRHVDIVTVQFYANFLISFLRKLLSLSPYHLWNLPWKLNNASTEAIISHCNCFCYAGDYFFRIYANFKLIFCVGCTLMIVARMIIEKKVKFFFDNLIFFNRVMRS